MAVTQTTFRVATRGLCDVIDITDQIESALAESDVSSGVVNVSGLGSTLGLTTIEFESGAVLDLKKALAQIAPMNDDYAHNARWGSQRLCPSPQRSDGHIEELPHQERETPPWDLAADCPLRFRRTPPRTRTYRDGDWRMTLRPVAFFQRYFTPTPA